MNRFQKGFTLVSAIFLIVVISLLTTYMVSINTVQKQIANYSILSSRALFAAESGIQWSIYTALDDNDCSAFPDTFNLSGGASGSFSVSVTCNLTTHTENPDMYNVYQLSSTATQGSLGGPDYIRRTISSSVTDAP
jgi:MSHA biogenesis protein MshP